MLWNEIALSNNGGTRMLPNTVTVTSSRTERRACSYLETQGLFPGVAFALSPFYSNICSGLVLG